MVENGIEAKDWTQQLFVIRPEVFLPWMESMKERTPAEVGGLRMIFEKFGIREGARVLDLASGIGRMSVNLAKAGVRGGGSRHLTVLSGILREMDKEGERRRQSSVLQ